MTWLFDLYDLDWFSASFRVFLVLIGSAALGKALATAGNLFLGRFDS